MTEHIIHNLEKKNSKWERPATNLYPPPAEEEHHTMVHNEKWVEVEILIYLLNSQ